MMAYIGQRQWLNNYEWKDKIKEGTTEDLIQMDSNKISGKVLNKVNYVNDWAVRLKEELGRKPSVKEVAERMGVSEDIVREAVSLSAEAIEDISDAKTNKDNDK